MVFSSPVFMFIFLPLVFITNLILPSRMRNMFLLFSSLVFYAWGEPVYVFLMLLSIASNYFLGLLINNERFRKTALLSAIIFNLSLLFVFKYADFITVNLAGAGLDITPTNIPLPIGISFFTFQALSYIIDVYRSGQPSEKSIFNVALYISFFPQLIAGPIVRYDDISEKLKRRPLDTGMIYSGVTRFAIGLSKKLLLANRLGETADLLFRSGSDNPGALLAWTGAIAYTLQIYFDFSGYSDMAIGLGRMFGFDFRENFNYPFISNSMNGFWKRWHISLTTWFREYLYIPLGGNRKGSIRTYINLLVVFFCTGFWHGAEWTFIVWGMSHGILMIIEKMASGIKLPRFFKYAGNIYMLFSVILTFTIFRSPDIKTAFSYIASMFSAGNDRLLFAQVFRPYSLAVFAIAIPATLPLKALFRRLLGVRIYEVLQAPAAIMLYIFCALVIAGETFNPFIYFRF